MGVRQTLQITSCTPWFLLGVRQTAMDIIHGKLIFLTIRGRAGSHKFYHPLTFDDALGGGEACFRPEILVVHALGGGEACFRPGILYFRENGVGETACRAPRNTSPVAQRGAGVKKCWEPAPL